jgi:hypothetical protein
LGNNRPEILVKLEDSVIRAILDISQGISTEAVLDTLYHQIELLQKDLAIDHEALDWFNLSRPAFSAPLTPPVGPIPLPGVSIYLDQLPSSIDFQIDRRACLPS